MVMIAIVSIYVVAFHEKKKFKMLSDMVMIMNSPACEINFPFDRAIYHFKCCFL